MKNRLQFKRFSTVFQTREAAEAALNEKIGSQGFIPLVGEPIVLRYFDGNGDIQLILAIGKSTAQGSVEYHFIDTAELSEGTEELSNLLNDLSGITGEFSAATNSPVNFPPQQIRDLMRSPELRVDSILL